MTNFNYRFFISPSKRSLLKKTTIGCYTINRKTRSVRAMYNSLRIAEMIVNWKEISESEYNAFLSEDKKARPANLT